MTNKECTESKPCVKLTGTDGNVFALAGKVNSALRKAGLQDKSIEFRKRLFSECKSYDEALQLMMEYVEVR